MTAAYGPVPDAPVLLSVVDGVGRIELNRPASGNAVDLLLISALDDTINRCARDPDVAVLALTGRGPMFCGGGDVAAMAAARDRGAFVSELAEAAHRVVLSLARLSKPVVVGTHGAAAGSRCCSAGTWSPPSAAATCRSWCPC